MIMNNFILGLFYFIYWLFCYAYCMTYIRDSFEKQTTFAKIVIVVLMVFSCVVATPFSIGSHLAGVFIRMKEE